MDFSNILSITTVLTSFVGVAAGIIFGFLPGLSTTMAVAVMLPFTFSMSPIQAFALLLGVYCGAMYGGSITAILIRTPGTPNSAATALDGYPLAQQGHGMEAMSTATICSFIGGVMSCIVLIFLAPKIARMALAFGPPEYFAVGLFGLSIVASLSKGNLLKGVIAACFGIMLSTIGLDPVTGIVRFTFGFSSLLAGLQIVAVLIGLFAISEILTKLETSRVKSDKVEKMDFGEKKMVSFKTLWSHKLGILRAAVIGIVVGIIPGTGGGTAGWISYNEAIRTSKHPEKFGNGALEGVIASECSNNAVTGGAMIPLLTLGVPGDSVTAILLGALMLQGLTPGPMLFTNNPDVVNAMYIMLILGNIFMLILGLSAIPLFVKVLKVPKSALMSCVLLLSCVGSFAMRNNILDMRIALLMGVIGYLFTKSGFSVPPVLLGMILGNIVEANFRRALIISNGSASIFFTRPIALVFIVLAAFAFAWPSVKAQLDKRKAGKTAAGAK